MIEDLVRHWGLLGIAAGTFFEGATVLVMGGALAHKGLISLPGVALAAFAGSLLGDQLWFLLGRRVGGRLLARRPVWQARADRVGALARRWGDGFVVGFRFAWGLRSVTPLILATSGYPWRRFAVLNVLGAALWAVAVSCFGWFAGAGFERMAGRAARVEEIALGLAVAALCLFLLRRYRQRRAAASQAI